MKILKFLVTLSFLTFSGFFNHAFASLEELIDFKVKHSAFVATNNIAIISDFGEKIKLQKKRKALIEIAPFLPTLAKTKISRAWLNWFKCTYGDRVTISHKEFAAAIFYPYEVLEVTHKQHLLQMNYAFKASVMYSSVFDAQGPGRMIKSLKSELDGDIGSDGKFIHFLDFGFIANSSSFLNKVKAYESAHLGILDRLKPQILSTGTAIQALNLGLILKHLNRDDEAFECFDISAQKGSLRASTEMGNIRLKRDFNDGVAFFRSLGAYGIWKIAQCYRYGINVERHLGIANHHYLEALSIQEVRKFPEILYDAADFAVYYAYSQSKPEVFKTVMSSAVKRFYEAGNLRLGLGYLKAAEISLDVANLFPGIIDPHFSADFRRDAAKKSLMEGHAAKITSLLQKIHLDDDMEMMTIRAYAEQIDRYLGE